MWPTLHSEVTDLGVKCSEVMDLDVKCCDFTQLLSADSPQHLHSADDTEQGNGQQLLVQPDLTDGGQYDLPELLSACTQPVSDHRPAHSPHARLLHVEHGPGHGEEAAQSQPHASGQSGGASVEPSDGGHEEQHGEVTGSRERADHHSNLPSPPSPHPAFRKCMRCQEAITERYLIQVNDGRFLHERCVVCQVCDKAVDTTTTRSVFLVDRAIFCRHHYTQMFTTKRKLSAACAACREEIRAGRDWVRLAGEQVYHVTCFACSQCGTQFASGALFVLRDGLPVCHVHLTHSSDQQGARGAGRVKRTRTQFTAEQYGALQRYFRHDSNPDSRRLDTMARELGLVKRHVQVWFQNNRARQKKLTQSRRS